MPKRIQRKRTKGWSMPEGAVYVGRPTLFGNPFKHSDPAVAVEAFRQMLEPSRFECDIRTSQGEVWAFFGGMSLQVVGKLPEWWLGHEIRETLRGRDLACWCPLDKPCHADVLLELANR